MIFITTVTTRFAYVSEGVMLCLCNGNGPAQVSICNLTPHVVSQVLYTLTFLWQTRQRYMQIFCLTEKESKTQRKIHNLAKIPKVLCTCGRAGVRTQVQLPSLSSFLCVTMASEHNFPLKRKVENWGSRDRRGRIHRLSTQLSGDRRSASKHIISDISIEKFSDREG